MPSKLARLDSPVFTGNPTAPTLAATDSDTSLATTGFVQAVQQAEWTQPAAISITAAGNSNVAAVSAQNRYLTQRINVAAFTGTATVTLQNTSALAGDKRRLLISMPASASTCVVEIRNLTNSGTLLATVATDLAIARSWVGYTTFDGTNWGAVSLAPQLVSEYTTAQISTATAALIEREGLRFDGTAVASFSNASGSALGTSNFTDILEFNIDSIGTARRIISRGSTRGDLYIEISGQVVFSSSIDSVIIYGPTVTAGTSYVLVVVRDASGVKISIDGGSTFTSSVSNSTVMEALTNMGRDVFNATSFFSGRISRYLNFNYALTASEIAALTRRGLVTLPEQRGGSMVALNTSSFTTVIGGTVSGASASGFVMTSVSGTSRAGSAPTLIAKVGTKYRATFTATLTSGQAPLVNIRQEGVADCTASQTVTAGSNTFEFIVSSGAAAASLQFNTTAASVYTISGFSLIPLGTLFEQDSGQRNAGYMVRDTSGNNLDLILPATGVSVIDPATRGMIRFITNTSGNQQIGGTQVIIPTNARISSWVINSSGTPNVTLGNVSAGAQYRASAAVVSGDNQITLLTPFNATGNLWVNSSSTATLKHTIMWEYIQ